MSGRRQLTHDELKNVAPEYLCTARDIHILTGMAEKLVREAMASGDLKSMTIGSGQELRVPKFRLREWERQQTSINERSVDRILRKLESK